MKQVILSAVVATFAVAAYAGPASTQSSQGVSDSAEASGNMSQTTSTSLLTASGETIQASITVVEDPSGASDASSQASGEAATWVFTKSGLMLKASVADSKAFVADPSAPATYSQTITLSANGVEYLVTASGQAVDASGAFLKDQYGNDAQLILTGGGKVLAAGSGSVVFIKTKTATIARKVGAATAKVARKVGAASGQASATSGAIVEGTSDASSTFSENVADASAAPFRRTE